MRHVLVYVLFIQVRTINCLNNIESFVSDFLVDGNIKFVAFFTCFKNHETVQISRVMNKLFIPSRFIAMINDRIDSNYEMFDEWTNVGFVQDLLCDNYKTVWKVAEQYNLYQEKFKWLIIDKNQRILENHFRVAKYFASISLRMDSDVTVAVFDSDNATLYDVYSPGFNNAKLVRVTEIGFWLPNNIIRTYNLSKYEQRKDMTNVILKSATVYTQANATMSIDSYYRDVRTKNYDTINKLNYGLFMHIQEIHNFTLILNITDRWFGNAEKGQTDDGLAKLLYEKTIDFAATSGIMKPARVRVLDFVAPTYPFRTCFIFRNPGVGTKIENQFLKPFSSSVWLTIVGCISMFCIIFKCVSIIEQSIFRYDEENSLIAFCLLTWSIMCQQGTALVPKPTSGRCILLTLLLLSLILYNYYVSIIVSSLLQGLPPPFKTIEELSHSNLDVGAEDIVYTRTLFEVTKDPRIQYLYKNKISKYNNQSSYPTVKDGIRRVKAGGFAYHTEAPTGYYLIEKVFESHEICDLAEINLFTPTVLWVYTQKRSQYKRLFAIGYLKMLESGIIFRQRMIWITRKPDCLSNTHLSQVGIQPVTTAFLVLIIGIFIAICLLILEIFFRRYYNRTTILKS